MTNYGALAILSLPRRPGSPVEADLRLLIALETIRVNGNGERYAGTRLLADLSGLSYRTVLRARDRLVKAGLIECSPGRGRARSGWRFLVPLDPPSGDSQRYITSSPSGDTQGGITSADPDAAARSGDSNGESQRDEAEGRSGDTSGTLRCTPGGQHALARSMNTGVEVGDYGSRAGARDDWHPGQVLEGRVIRRSQSRGPSGGPPAWTTHKRQPDEVAKRGAALARELLSGTRPEPEPGSTPVLHTDDDRRAEARRQVRESRAARDASPHPQPGSDEGPLWAEDDPDDPPF